MLGIELIVILVMVGINAVFAGYEIALASVNVGRLQLLVRENRRGARAALSMKQSMEASLAAVQVGITLVGAIAAATGGAGAEEVLAPWLREQAGLSSAMASVAAITVVVVPLTFVTIMCGELLPKVFAIRNKELVCLRLSPAMYWFTVSVWPAVWLFETSVRAIMRWTERVWKRSEEGGKKGEAIELQEIRADAALARASRLIGEREESIIVGAAGLPSRPVRQIMLPAQGISMLNVGASLGDSLIAAHLDMHTRFPLAERVGDPQSIVGYVNFKDLVVLLRLSSPFEASLRSIMRPIPRLDEGLAIANCLERMIREHTHIAIVQDATGQIVGMITLEDILEELVGEIQDEYDRLPVHLVPSGPAWVAGGGITLGRLKEVTEIDLSLDLPSSPARNLSDWVAGHLGRPATGGEVLERNGVRVVVRKVRRQQAMEVQVGRLDAGAGPVRPEPR